MRTLPFDPNSRRMAEDILKIEAFKPLGRERLPSVMKSVAIREYNLGETLIVQGDTDQTLFFLMHGKLSVQVDKIEVNVLGTPGSVFGEMGIIDRSPRSASVIAKRPSRCLAMEAGFFDSLEGRQRLVVQAFFYKMTYEIMAQRLRETNARIADLDLQKTVLECMNID